jgi:hypothetical protein
VASNRALVVELIQETDHVANAVLIDANGAEIAVGPDLVHLKDGHVMGPAVAVGLEEKAGLIHNHHTDGQLESWP